MKIKTLPREFLKNGFLHTQLDRAGQIALYQRAKDGLAHYEVVKIVTRKPHYDSEMEFDMVESYPGTETWGSLGFTYKTKKDATNKFMRLEKRQGAVMTLVDNQNAPGATEEGKNELL